MNNIKSNIEELRKILNEEKINKEEALEFLDSIDEQYDEFENEHTDCASTISDLEKKNEELVEENELLQEKELDCKKKNLIAR